MAIQKNNDYAGGAAELLREQYKRLPRLGALLRMNGERAQGLEDALYQFFSFQENFGTGASAPRGALNDKALMFGVEAPDSFSEADLRLELKAAMIAAFSVGRAPDLAQISKRLYGLDSHIVSYAGGFVISVFGDISSAGAKAAKLIFKTARRMAPAATACFGVA